MGELISQGGVSLRVRGVKVPRGILFFFFFPLISLGMVWLLFPLSF